MISVHPLFLMMLVMWILSGQLNDYALLIGALLWHELGHIVFSKLVGAKIQSIVLLPFGGTIKLDAHATNRQRLWSACGGPVFTWFAFLGGAFLPPLWQEPWQFIQLTLLIVNLLPIYPLDGGRIICHGLLCLVPQRKVYEMYITFSFYLLTLIVVILLIKLPNTILLLMASLLLWGELLGEWKIRKYRSIYEKIVLNRLT